MNIQVNFIFSFKRAKEVTKRGKTVAAARKKLLNVKCVGLTHREKKLNIQLSPQKKVNKISTIKYKYKYN